jgi:hypothetical protein
MHAYLYTPILTSCGCSLLDISGCSVFSVGTDVLTTLMMMIVMTMVMMMVTMMMMMFI